MKTQNYSRNVYNLCLYIKKRIIRSFILLFYMLILVKNQFNVDKCKYNLKSIFKMNYLDKSENILGMNIHKDLKQNKLWLS